MDKARVEVRCGETLMRMLSGWIDALNRLLIPNFYVVNQSCSYFVLSEIE